jgi:hypothetical protein
MPSTFLHFLISNWRNEKGRNLLWVRFACLHSLSNGHTGLRSSRVNSINQNLSKRWFLSLDNTAPGIRRRLPGLWSIGKEILDWRQSPASHCHLMVQLHIGLLNSRNMWLKVIMQHIHSHCKCIYSLRRLIFRVLHPHIYIRNGQWSSTYMYYISLMKVVLGTKSVCHPKGDGPFASGGWALSGGERGGNRAASHCAVFSPMSKAHIGSTFGFQINDCKEKEIN